VKCPRIKKPLPEYRRAATRGTSQHSEHSTRQGIEPLPPRTNIWFRYHTGDFALRCSKLTLEEEGAYHRLLRHYWDQQHPLVNDDRVLSRLAGVTLRTWKKLRSGISRLFDVSSGQWRLRWLDEEMGNAREVSRKRAEAGRKGGHEKAKSRLANARQLPESISSNCLDSHSHSHREDYPGGDGSGQNPKLAETEIEAEAQAGTGVLRRAV
jgi:uncharacterized protein YdaU (DUF1376 family)